THRVSPHLSVSHPLPCLHSFLLHDPSPTQIYTLSLHDALPISSCAEASHGCWTRCIASTWPTRMSRLVPSSSGATSSGPRSSARSEEHTSELQSRFDIVCRLLLEKKKYAMTP